MAQVLRGISLIRRLLLTTTLVAATAFGILALPAAPLRARMLPYRLAENFFRLHFVAVFALHLLAPALTTGPVGAVHDMVPHAPGTLGAAAPFALRKLACLAKVYLLVDGVVRDRVQWPLLAWAATLRELALEAPPPALIMAPVEPLFESHRWELRQTFLDLASLAIHLLPSLALLHAVDDATCARGVVHEVFDSPLRKLCLLKVGLRHELLTEGSMTIDDLQMFSARPLFITHTNATQHGFRQALSPDCHVSHIEPVSRENLLAAVAFDDGVLPGDLHGLLASHATQVLAARQRVVPETLPATGHGESFQRLPHLDASVLVGAPPARYEHVLRPLPPRMLKRGETER